jgi:hypothetical protein
LCLYAEGQEDVHRAQSRLSNGERGYERNLKTGQTGQGLSGWGHGGHYNSLGLYPIYNGAPLAGSKQESLCLCFFMDDFYVKKGFYKGKKRSREKI